MTKKPAKKQQAVEGGGVEVFFVAALDRIMSLCPKNMRVAIVVHHIDKGPVVIGNCCETCTGALIHMAAEMIEDPRAAWAEARNSASVH